jgi:hypothetical protein
MGRTWLAKTEPLRGNYVNSVYLRVSINIGPARTRQRPTDQVISLNRNYVHDAYL